MTTSSEQEPNLFFSGLVPAIRDLLAAIQFFRRSKARRLQSNRFVAAGRRGLTWKRRPDDAAVLVELHAQAEAHLHQYVLDLVERLATEVLGLQHFVLALLHELTDGLDV